MWALRHSIGTKIFGAFLAMSLIVAGLGAYGYIVLRASEDIVANTYDHPMMAINFARAASVDFLEMENTKLRNDASAARAKQIDTLAATLSDDLDVADERSTAADERAVIATIRKLVRQWQTARHAALARQRPGDLSAVSQKILDRFDFLIELNADHGFISRREAVTHVQNYEDAVIAVTFVALLLAGAITIFLARRIVRPLSAAALVAERIAAGELQTAIPKGGPDETGALLNSMQVMQDSIAEQMAREQARAQSAEGRLLDAVESSSQGIVLMDADGLIAISNSGMARMFPDLTPQIAPSRPLATMFETIDAKSQPSPDAPRSLLDIVAAVRSNISASAERLLPDGRWLRITASPTSEGGAVLFFSDFTEIKAREEKYRVAKQQAEAASAAKSRFLANMSHELRTPLNAIIGFSEIIASEAFGPVGNPRYVDYSGDILHSGRHLLEVINNVLDLARSGADRMEMDKRPVDLNLLLDECSHAWREQAIAAGLSLTTDRPDERIFVEGDEGKLRQIFLNLLSNAIKFTEHGAVTLRLAADDGDAKIEIHDTGIGMSPEGIETALMPFGQVDNRLERRYEGSGLGLPLTKALVEMHGGTLVIDSAPGKGTTVTVRLKRYSGAVGVRDLHSAAG